MVWHKGRIYVIGGCPSSDRNFESYNAEKFIEYLGYNSRLNWLSVDENDYVFINGAKKSDLKRSNHGVCSFGDEIFIFGGEINNDRNSQAISNIAINPETKVVRRLTSLPQKLTNCDAVVYGSKIYIIGMNFEHNLTFYEYTP